MDLVFAPLTHDDPRELGGYRILARLGAGGMGRVYLAATQSGRRLAVKVVRPEFADDPEFRRRFRHELAAAQRVHSLFTAQVIDAAPNAPRPWFATAYVPGPSLHQAVAAHGPLPVDSVRRLTAGVAEALQAVHAAGVIHRDLKPSNVLLAPDGPRVIDFGIARAADATPLTRTGLRIGSPQFMSPEQALGRSATPAVDLFALGSLAFFAATGHAAFGEGPENAILYRIVHEEPDLGDCPAELRPVIERCLAKDPERRPAPVEIIETWADSTREDWLPPALTAKITAYDRAPLPPVPPTTPGGSTRMFNRTAVIVAGAVLSAATTLTVVVAQLSHGPNRSGAAGPTGSAAASPRPTAAEPAPSSLPESPPPETQAPAVRRTGTLTLNADYAADLDSLAPDWGITAEDRAVPSSSLTIALHPGQALEYTVRAGFGSELAVVSGTPSYDRCAGTTDYGAELTTANTHVGTAVCIRTIGDRPAALRVKRFRLGDDGLSSVTFSVTVWESASSESPGTT